jgi:sugar phosphate isomerase/epimerase
MKIGVWSSYFIDLSPEEMVKTFSKKGWYNLELSDEHGAELLKRGNPELAGKNLRSFAEAHGVSFPQGHLWLSCDIASVKQAEVLDTLKGWLDLFLAVGVHSAVLHPGGREMMGEGYPLEKIEEARLYALKVLTSYIKGTDMVICLENVSRDKSECDNLCGLVEKIGDANLGICLDTGHLNLAGGNQGDFIRRAGKNLKALHIADNEGVSDQHLMPFGKGTVKWKDVTEALKEINYKGLFNYEIPGESGRCPLPVKLAKLDYLKEVSAYLLGAENIELKGLL